MAFIHVNDRYHMVKRVKAWIYTELGRIPYTGNVTVTIQSCAFQTVKNMRHKLQLYISQAAVLHIAANSS